MLTPTSRFRPILLCSLLALSACNAAAQQPCVAPQILQPTTAPNIFSPQQELDLGDAMAESLAHHFRLSDDPQVTSYMARIVTRLLKHLPPLDLRPRIFLVDLPVANAFNVPGGHIYVSPKLIALARNEDELAAVLSHELGHLAAHQSAILTTREMAVVLKVRQVGDRRDIFEKYNRLQENNWKIKTSPLTEKQLEEREWTADNVGLYAVAGAGYSVEAIADMYDRLTGAGMKTGNWATDVFGTTSSESKRLREMIQHRQALPDQCIDRASKASDTDFRKWQSEVINYSGWNQQEALHDVLRTLRLTPTLRGHINHIKFSPDGKYLLAQDDASIDVLTRDPLALLFQIDAPDAGQAQFSPDGSLVVFHTRHLRVESWSVASHLRVSASEINSRSGCWQSDLSLDGKTLACLERTSGPLAAGADLLLFDVSSGQEVFRKKGFFPNRLASSQSGLFTMHLLGLDLDLRNTFESGVMYTGFSPDGRYFLAGRTTEDFLIDLQTRQPVPMPRALSTHLSGGFAFLGSDRIVGVNIENPKKSRVMAFPSGQELGEVDVGNADLHGATRGDYAIFQTLKGTGALGLNGAHSFSTAAPAVDVYDKVGAGEQIDGELSLFDVSTLNTLVTISLPGGHLGSIRAAALSPDWKYLAVSGPERGAAWELDDGSRLFLVKGFKGVYIPNDYVLYADFPKTKDDSGGITQISLLNGLANPLSPPEGNEMHQHGALLVVTERAGRGDFMIHDQPETLDVYDVSSGNKLWSRAFERHSPLYTANSGAQRMVLWWPESSPQVKIELDKLPSAANKFASMKQKQGASFFEVLDALTGNVLGAMTGATGQGSELGNYGVKPESAGDYVAVAEPENRVVLYSLSSGNEVGRCFGHGPVLSAPSGLLSLENEDGHLNLYQLETGEELDGWVFNSPIRLREFSADGKRLFVLTSDETAYVLDVSRYSQSGSKAN